MIKRQIQFPYLRVGKSHFPFVSFVLSTGVCSVSVKIHVYLSMSYEGASKGVVVDVQLTATVVTVLTISSMKTPTLILSHVVYSTKLFNESKLSSPPGIITYAVQVRTAPPNSSIPG